MAEPRLAGLHWRLKSALPAAAGRLPSGRMCIQVKGPARGSLLARLNREITGGIEGFGQPCHSNRLETLPNQRTKPGHRDCASEVPQGGVNKVGSKKLAALKQILSRSGTTNVSTKGGE